MLIIPSALLCVSVWIFQISACLREVKILTGITGYINHYAGISANPNCKLVWQCSHGLGEHTLALEVICAVPAATELLIDYGPLHPIGEQAVKGGAQKPRASVAQKTKRKPNPKRTAKK